MDTQRVKRNKPAKRNRKNSFREYVPLHNYNTKYREKFLAELNSHVGVHSLPDEILQTIFRKLDNRSLVNCTLVSRRWFSSIKTDMVLRFKVYTCISKLVKIKYFRRKCHRRRAHYLRKLNRALRKPYSMPIVGALDYDIRRCRVEIEETDRRLRFLDALKQMFRDFQVYVPNLGNENEEIIL